MMPHALESWTTSLDESAWLFDEIAVSVGRKGLQIWLAPADFVRATQATVVAVGWTGRQHASGQDDDLAVGALGLHEVEGLVDLVEFVHVRGFDQRLVAQPLIEEA